jgi:hypothetical protein
MRLMAEGGHSYQLSKTNLMQWKVSFVSNRHKAHIRFNRLDIPPRKERSMIEINMTSTYAEAQKRAHRERGAAFAQMMRALPRLVKSIRSRT